MVHTKKDLWSCYDFHDSILWPVYAFHGITEISIKCFKQTTFILLISFFWAIQRVCKLQDLPIRILSGTFKILARKDWQSCIVPGSPTLQLVSKSSMFHRCCITVVSLIDMPVFRRRNRWLINVFNLFLNGVQQTTLFGNGISELLFISRQQKMNVDGMYYDFQLLLPQISNLNFNVMFSMRISSSKFAPRWNTLS